MSAVTPLRTRREPPVSDADLLAEVARDAPGALGELFDRHAVEVRAFATRLVGPTDADDVVQETFVRVARLASGFDGRASARAWLFGVAYHVIRERRRAFARLREALRRFGESGEATPAGRAPEVGSDIVRALDRLDEPKRAVVLLAEVHELTGAEIAEALGEPVGTVWARLHRARAELRETAERDGRLSEREKDRALEHRRSCEVCGAEQASLEQLGEELRASRPSTDDLALRRVRNAVLARVSRPEARPASRSRGVVFAAAAIALGVGLAGWAKVREPESATRRFSEEVVIDAHEAGLASHVESAGEDRVVLSEGRFSIDVRKQAPGKRLVFALPDGEIEDRGTRFEVNVRGGRTTGVVVHEGAVVLRRTGKSEVHLAAGASWSPAVEATPGDPSEREAATPGAATPGAATPVAATPAAAVSGSLPALPTAPPAACGAASTATAARPGWTARRGDPGHVELDRSAKRIERHHLGRLGARRAEVGRGPEGPRGRSLSPRRRPAARGPCRGSAPRCTGLPAKVPAGVASQRGRGDREVSCGNRDAGGDGGISEAAAGAGWPRRAEPDRDPRRHCARETARRRVGYTRGLQPERSTIDAAATASTSLEKKSQTPARWNPSTFRFLSKCQGVFA